MNRNICEKVNNLVSSVDGCSKGRSKREQEALNGLYVLRRKAVQAKEEAKKAFDTRENELQRVNEGICQIQGHTYKRPWKENEGEIGIYYTNICEICGEKTRVIKGTEQYKRLVLLK